jgi:hypothetical protein
LHPYRLHLIVEGATEVRVINKLFEAFSRRTLAQSGIGITDLGGDKLEGSRPMLEGLAAYAEDIALLLDDENEVARITRKLSESGLFPERHVTLSEPSFEEQNFTAAELIEVVAEMATADGVELSLDAAELESALESQNQGQRRRIGMASVLQKLARSPEHGAVTFTKPELGDALAETILAEIRAADGDHEKVAERRPIVGWVLAYPIRASQGR